MLEVMGSEHASDPCRRHGQKLVLNEHTKKDFYPLPNLRAELEKLSKHRLFSKFDVRLAIIISE